MRVNWLSSAQQRPVASRGTKCGQREASFARSKGREMSRSDRVIWPKCASR